MTENLVETLPAGYQIQESVNGIVSLSKAQPVLLSEEDIRVVRNALQAHPQAQRYRLDVKAKLLTVYEHVGPDLLEVGAQLAAKLGQPLTEDLRERFREEEARYGQFTPILRFILLDGDRHTFRAQRMCFLGSIDDWIDIGVDKPLSELAESLIPALGTDAFFGLY